MFATRFLAHQTEEIRRLYSRWDRGMLTDNAFLTALSEDLKVPLTEEFRHQLAVHGPARNLSFAKMLRALRIDNFLAKGTVPHSFAENPGRVFSTAAGEESGGQVLVLLSYGAGAGFMAFILSCYARFFV